MKLVWVYVFSMFILRWVDGFDLFGRELHRPEVPANGFDFLGQPKVPQPDAPAHGFGFLGHHRMPGHDIAAHGHHLSGPFIPFTLPPFLIGPNLFKDLNVIELGWMGHPDNTGQLVSKNASDDASTQGPLMVGITIVKEAAEVGAVCLDGTPPAYHLDKGFGSGENSWLVHLEGGGWCSTIRECTYRKNTSRGSSDHMEKETPFIGILSSDPNQNPDFYNWNRVKIRYCDGASFSGDSENEAENLYFRGQRIWSAVMKQLMSNGMASASQALLSGCSAGGLSSILHCDEFRGLFPSSTKVKCFSDAGLFLDALDVSGKRTLRSLYGNVVSLQGVKKSLPTSCTSHMDPTLCFFPENRVAQIETPLFLLNAAYDSWQIQVSLTPRSADPNGNWSECRLNYTTCDASQIQFLQDFRNQMLESIKTFSASKQNGLFINSCFAHCQSERADTWFGKAAPTIENKGIAQSVGDWYFDRSEVKTIDCPFPCDKTCHNLIFKSQFRDN